MPEPVSITELPAPVVTVSLPELVVTVNKPAVAAEGPVTATPVKAGPAPVLKVIAPVAAEASTVVSRAPPAVPPIVSALSPVKVSLIRAASVNVLNVLATPVEAMVKFSTPATDKEEPALTLFSVAVIVSAVVLATAAVV